MKLKHFIYSVVGLLAFTSVQAFAQSVAPKMMGDRTVYVSTYGLQAGSVDIKITTDKGKTYYFTGSSPIIYVPGEVRLGEFAFTGSTYFDVEVTPKNASPAFSRIAGAAFLHISTPESLTSRVTWWPEDDFNDATGLVIVFNRPY